MKNPNKTEEQQREENMKKAAIIGGTILLIAVAWFLLANQRKTVGLADVMSQLHSL